MAKKKNISSILVPWPAMASWMLNNFKFVLLIVALGVIYISFVRQAERNIVEIQSLKNDVEKLRWEYMSLQSELMYSSTQSQILRSLRDRGFSLSEKGPKRIVVPKNYVKLNTPEPIVVDPAIQKP